MSLRKQQQEIQKHKEIKDSYDQKKGKYDILNTSRKGELVADGVVSTADIMHMADIGTREKVFSLKMENGPYKVRYSPSGDTALYMGQEEVKSVNMMGLTANAEVHLGDRIYDGTFLHSGAFYALAQSKAVYIYDKTGVEVHVMRNARKVQSIKFLQDHFLLATVSQNGYLNYQDTTIGKHISEIKTREREPTMEVDRTNGVVYLTGSSGTVSLWSPRSPEYLSKVLCHRSRVSHCKISDDGRAMYTASKNELKKWDIRNMFSPMEETTMPSLISEMALSQTGKLAVAQRSHVLVHNQYLAPEIQHYTGREMAASLAYMPYEDVLTLGTGAGIENVIIPGAGLEVYRRHETPRASKKDRQDMEVRRILEKIPADMISLDNETGTEMKELFKEEITPMKFETPAGKVRRMMKMNYG
ncbi:U3 small nucleolar RNA-associated protein 7 [Nematocida major]|uniref:U3 small nucleolar RNA-associated protein 7 n=1 Tax=Nematocida major TaxID=1912982 RepID=UPI0020088CFA|nr:U3 small nucleolar RNA-associated protein 7 [Nematocida major]KAH9386796.1 U3 small nucleolar RNA-associated protein 7 [Nematocida major]